MKNYEEIAFQFAKEYGITQYQVKDNKMFYTHVEPAECYLYKCVINLDNMEETREGYDLLEYQ